MQTALSTNFVGEIKDYKELIQHLNDQKTQKDISEFCTFNNIAVVMGDTINFQYDTILITAHASIDSIDY